MGTLRLKDFDIGDAARIVGFAPAHRSYRAKLLSMGLTKGTIIHVRNIAPLGDPIHISVRDFDLSLRRDEAETLLLEPVDDGVARDGQPGGCGTSHGRRKRGRRNRGRGFFGRGRRAAHRNPDDESAPPDPEVNHG